MIITKPKETKEAFINEIKNNNDYIKAFSTSLEKSGDTKARQIFTSLSNADQSQETLKFIDTLDTTQKPTNLNTDNLIKQILEPQLKAIYDEKDENTKFALS